MRHHVPFRTTLTIATALVVSGAPAAVALLFTTDSGPLTMDLAKINFRHALPQRLLARPERQSLQQAEDDEEDQRRPEDKSRIGFDDLEIGE